MRKMIFQLLVTSVVLFMSFSLTTQTGVQVGDSLDILEQLNPPYI